MENSDANKFSNDLTLALIEKFSPSDRKLILLQIDANIRTAHEQAIEACEKAVASERLNYEQFLNPKTEPQPMKY